MSFQRDAFQPDGFHSGATESKEAFQHDAFQGFQQGLPEAGGTICVFDPLVFDPAMFDTCVEVPVITSHPTGATIASGGSHTMSVTATGTAPLTYQWYIGTSGDTSNPIGGATSSTYDASPAATTDYWVRVSNDFGSADSNTATVTIEGAEQRQTPAGKSKPDRKRKRYFVEIDGQDFPVSSPEEARTLLQAAKEALQEQIAEPVKRAKKGKLPVNKPRIRVTGIPGPELTEIVQAIAGIRDEIGEMYRDAARTAEIAYLIGVKKKRDDEEALLLLL